MKSQNFFENMAEALDKLLFEKLGPWMRRLSQLERRVDIINDERMVAFSRRLDGVEADQAFESDWVRKIAAEEIAKHQAQSNPYFGTAGDTSLQNRCSTFINVGKRGGQCVLEECHDGPHELSQISSEVKDLIRSHCDFLLDSDDEKAGLKRCSRSARCTYWEGHKGECDAQFEGEVAEVVVRSFLETAEAILRSFQEYGYDCRCNGQEASWGDVCPRCQVDKYFGEEESRFWRKEEAK